MVEQMVQQKIDVIFADSAPSTQAAYRATRSIPIVALDYTNDPVAAGYAESYGRPGKNITGVFLDAPEFAGKWFELLTAVVPRLSYGPVQAAVYERCGEFVAKILNGSSPSELPVERPSKFQLLINLKTMERLGLKVPEEVMVRADELIR